MAELLLGSVGSHGTVIRYAGDEFVIVLNTDNEEVAESYRERIKLNLAKFNAAQLKKYKLSVSIGLGIFDLNESSFDEMLEIIDKRMYEDKRLFYETESHDRRHRCK